MKLNGPNGRMKNEGNRPDNRRMQRRNPQKIKEIDAKIKVTV